MDPLQQYAQQAGLLGGTVPGLGGVPNSALAGITDEDLMGNFVPGYVPEGPVTSPSQIPDPVAPAPGPVTMPSNVPVGGDTIPQDPAPPQPGPSAPTSVKTSSSEAGYSPDKAALIAAGPEGQQLATAMEQNAVAAEQEAMEATLAQSLAARKQKNAIFAAEDAQIGYDEALAREQAEFIREKTRLDDGLSAAFVKSSNEKRAALADYTASLAEWRSARVDPGQLWGNLSGGERVGLMAAAFVDGFLGAKGVKSNAMQYWEKAVDRNIAAQIDNIRNKQQVSAAFKQVYEMQSAISDSEAETRARMRGFYLEGLKLQLEQHMLQFKTPLTAANAQKAAAEVDAALANEFVKIQQHQTASENAKNQLAVQVHGQQLQAAQAKASRALGYAELAQRRAENTPPADSNPHKYYIFDPTAGGQGAAIAEFRVGPGIDPKTGKITEAGQKYLEKHAAVSELNDAIEEYREAVRQGNKDITDIGRLSSTTAARLNSLRNDILAARIKAISGASATDKEVVRLATSVPDALVGTQADLDAVLAGFQKRATRELNSQRTTVADDFGPKDPRKNVRLHRGTLNAPGMVDATATDRSVLHPVGVSAVDVAQQLGDVDRTGDAKKSTVKDAKGYTVTDKDGNEKTLKQIADEVSGLDTQVVWEEFAGSGGSTYASSKSIPDYGARVAGLYGAALKGNVSAVEELQKIKAIGDEVKAPKTVYEESQLSDKDRTRLRSARMADWALQKLSEDGSDPLRQQSRGQGVIVPDVFQLSRDAGVYP